MTRVDLPQSAADSLSGIIERVGNGERLILDRDGKPVAAVVSVEDLAALEEIEDRLDVEAAERALAEIAAGRDKVIPLEEVEARLDRLKD